jgi:hypothetical protein
MITVKDLAGTMIFAILLGVFSGACISLMPAVLGKYPALYTTPVLNKL